MASFVIDPEAKLDFGLDWSQWLADGDTIATSSWTITPTGPALTSSTHDTTTTTVWVDNATAGLRYDLTNHVITSAGREDDRTVRLRCVNR